MKKDITSWATVKEQTDQEVQVGWVTPEEPETDTISFLNKLLYWTFFIVKAVYIDLFISAFSFNFDVIWTEVSLFILSNGVTIDLSNSPFDP